MRERDFNETSPHAFVWMAMLNVLSPFLFAGRRSETGPLWSCSKLVNHLLAQRGAMQYFVLRGEDNQNNLMKTEK